MFCPSCGIIAENVKENLVRCKNCGVYKVYMRNKFPEKEDQNAQKFDGMLNLAAESIASGRRVGAHSLEHVKRVIAFAATYPEINLSPMAPARIAILAWKVCCFDRVKETIEVDFNPLIRLIRTESQLRHFEAELGQNWNNDKIYFGEFGKSIARKKMKEMSAFIRENPFFMKE